jgi:DNA-binding FadR family transcriptional regulator
VTDSLLIQSGDDNYAVHHPRLAEVVADVLRRRIVEGALPDGARLPKQDELLVEFKISRPSLREALRILEAEGLIVVKRGNVGGAVVKAPDAQGSAHAFGLVLQARHVVVEDLAEAIRNVEPVAAILCARRKDRKKTVVPRLLSVQGETERVIGEGPLFTQMARRFHEELVLGCGNQTLTAMLVTFEAMWSQQEREWARRANNTGSYPSPTYQKYVLAAHRDILEAITDGDEDRVAKLSRAHLEKSQIYTLADASNAIVQAPPMRGFDRFS